MMMFAPKVERGKRYDTLLCHGGFDAVGVNLQPCRPYATAFQWPQGKRRKKITDVDIVLEPSQTGIEMDLGRSL